MWSNFLTTVKIFVKLPILSRLHEVGNLFAMVITSTYIIDYEDIW